MAVYQGARLRSGALPAAGSMARPARAAAPATVSTSPRVRPMGLLMAVIVAATMLGMVYLTQTLGTAHTSYEIQKLEDERASLVTEIGRNERIALGLTQPEKILPRAQEQKLKQLGDPIVLPAP